MSGVELGMDGANFSSVAGPWAAEAVAKGADIRFEVYRLTMPAADYYDATCVFFGGGGGTPPPPPTIPLSRQRLQR